MKATIKFDGGTRPTNPGHSAIGYIISTDDSTERGSHHIGEATKTKPNTMHSSKGFRRLDRWDVPSLWCEVTQNSSSSRCKVSGA